MKADLKKRWVKALRSGEFKKGKMYLKRELDNGEVRYCCLGVLCEIQNARMKDDGICYTVGGDQGSLNVKYRNRYGLKTDVQDLLIDMNDDRSWSFNRIATWIEKNL